MKFYCLRGQIRAYASSGRLDSAVCKYTDNIQELTSCDTDYAPSEGDGVERLGRLCPCYL